MIKKYIETIEAVQVEHDTYHEIRKWIGEEEYSLSDMNYDLLVNYGLMMIDQLYEETISIGSWLIKNRNGKFIQMIDKNFKQKYQEVKDD